MNLLKQKGDQCGQTCIAMIAGVNIDKAVMVCGRKGGTTTIILRRGMKELGIKTSELIRVKKEKIPGDLPELCICKVHFGKRKGTHWVIWNGKENCWYDPGSPSGARFHKDRYKYPNWPDKETLPRITSYIEVFTNGNI